MKSTLLWIATVLFTIVIAYYQKTTGPTYPVRGTVNLIEQEIKFKLLRSYNSGIDMPISFEAADPNIIGQIKFKRFKSHDDWTIKSLKRDGILLSTTMPSQPPAGKLIYEVYLGTNLENLKSLTKEPVIARYKGAVPAYFLIPHIFFMFLAMLFASRTGVEAIIDGPKIATQTQMTVLFLFIGGIILGPIVQKFAFGAFCLGVLSVPQMTAKSITIGTKVADIHTAVDNFTPTGGIIESTEEADKTKHSNFFKR